MDISNRRAKFNLDFKEVITRPRLLRKFFHGKIVVSATIYDFRLSIKYHIISEDLKEIPNSQETSRMFVKRTYKVTERDCIIEGVKKERGDSILIKLELTYERPHNEQRKN